MGSLILINHTTIFFITKNATGFDLITSSTDRGSIFIFPAQVFYVKKQKKIWNCQDAHGKACAAWQLQRENDSEKWT